MIKIHKEISLTDFDAWSEEARYTLNLLIEKNLIDDFEFYINDLYPDGIEETDLNDILRFEDIEQIIGED